MSTSASVLRELHRIHQQLSDLRDRKARGPKQIEAHRANVGRLEQALAQTQDEAKTARMAADEKQLQLKTGEGKITELRTKLNQAASNREYQALLEQIAADEMANSVLEVEILEGFERIDELQKATAEAEQNLTRSREELAKVEAKVADEAERIQGDIVRLESDLKSTEGSMPGDFREIYSRSMKTRGEDGMAEIEGECCGGCFQQVPPNHINQVYLQKPVLCTACGRLLYLPEDRSPGRG